MFSKTFSSMKRNLNYCTFTECENWTYINLKNRAATHLIKHSACCRNSVQFMETLLRKVLSYKRKIKKKSKNKCIRRTAEWRQWRLQSQKDARERMEQWRSASWLFIAPAFTFYKPGVFIRSRKHVCFAHTDVHSASVFKSSVFRHVHSRLVL